MSEIKFPSEVPSLATVTDETVLLSSKDGLINKVTIAQVVNKAAELVQVDGGAIPAIQGGATSATAVALPNLGSGVNKYFDASAGFWKYNGVVLLNPEGTEGIPEGSDGVVFWNGITEVWSISKMQELPIVPSDKLTEIPQPLAELTVNSILVEEGLYYKSKLEITSFPFSGVINSTNGVYTDTVGRKATDYIDISNYSHVIVNCNVINSATGTAFY